MSFRHARRKLQPLERMQKCWMHFYCFLVQEITKWADIFTGWFHYIYLDSCKVWKHLQTLYRCCAWPLIHVFVKVLDWIIYFLTNHFTLEWIRTMWVYFKVSWNFHFVSFFTYSLFTISVTYTFKVLSAG